MGELSGDGCTWQGSIGDEMDALDDGSRLYS